MPFQTGKFDSTLSPIPRLLAVEKELVAAGQRFGLQLKKSAPDIQAHLATLHETRLLHAEVNLLTLKRTWEICVQDGIDPWDDVKFLSLSMRALNLNYPQDFSAHLRADDLIEGYDADHFQVFRNMRFMRMSPYSLLEVQSYKWPVLFQRAADISAQLIQHCDKSLWDNKRSIPLQIPEHPVQAHKGLSYRVTFRQLAPLFFGTHRHFGILLTCQIR